MCVLSAIFGLTHIAIGTCGKEKLCVSTCTCTCVLNYYVHVLAHFRDTVHGFVTPAVSFILS